MRYSSLFLALLATPAAAEVPQVVTDIAPVHSVVAYVMQGVGTPSLLIPPGSSPHGYSMRPSEARALAKADLVVWVGHGLTPWLEEPIDSLAPNAQRIELTDLPEMVLLPYREGVSFAEDPHDHGHDDHDDHDKEHADHDDHDKEHADHDDHDKEHAEHGHKDEHDAHDHEAAEGMDPHLWLDPKNAATIALALAKQLGESDPENASIYMKNALQFQGLLEDTETQISGMLSPVNQARFIVFHDAFQYFEARFGIEATASVAEGDAAKPGAGRISDLQARLEEKGAVCAFSEPQMNTDILGTVTEGQTTNVAILDPLGASLTPGPDLYPQLLRDMAEAMVSCLSS